LTVVCCLSSWLLTKRNPLSFGRYVEKKADHPTLIWYACPFLGGGKFTVLLSELFRSVAYCVEQYGVELVDSFGSGAISTLIEGLNKVRMNMNVAYLQRLFISVFMTILPCLGMRHMRSSCFKALHGKKAFDSRSESCQPDVKLPSTIYLSLLSTQNNSSLVIF
jgi:hypothetical protein